jgi:hypothetical protein
MTANELRIGNKVLFIEDKSIVTVTEIYKDAVTVDDIHCCLTDIQGIEITLAAFYNAPLYKAWTWWQKEGGKSFLTLHQPSQEPQCHYP